MLLIKTNKLIILLVLYLAFVATATAQTHVGKTLKVTIFSSTPIEDIRATSNAGIAVLTLDKQELAVQIPIKSLTFDKKLMQEHFNENYMESDKYPLAQFKGIIEPKIDWKKDGEYNVIAKGNLTIHGVSQARNIQGKISIKNGIISLQSAFDVACEAHKIKIPSIVFTKIAEVIKVTIQGTLTPLTK